ncbi:queuosine transporter QueT [Ligilactobacillus salitolerans]|uniref:Queuosine transporter QueT n=1 Tax=Ligilactobacillus salitolerans TaxID=1808352 RepID=A0A401IVA2_9LACO|nr:QueT transporter family protein [Ligilactobacillus salitolerans]GBG95480.1 queuosine transporter QueT [Ligilactobacillus salitolerans]
MEKSQTALSGLTKTALIAALYVVMTLAISPFSYGPIQLRLAEMLNNLAVFNKRYIWALSLGCLIANLWSPLGMVDVVFGTLGTLVMTSLSWFLSRHVRSVPAKLAISVTVCTLMTWSVALELHFVSHAPFWWTYLTVGCGEFISMALGAVLTYVLSSRFELRA